MIDPTVRVSGATVLLLLALTQPLRADALARLRPERLEAVRRDVAALRAEWRAVPRSGPLAEYRANLHVHSLLSHDSRATLSEIVIAAKQVGTHILMFTEHPADHYDYYRDGHQGMKDGVLLIPGAETRGFLVYPKESLRGLDAGSPQEFSDLVRRRGGLTFLSHLEERMSWDIRGLTGVEIYNTHADVKEEKALLAALRNPLWIWKSVDLFNKYPQEAFSALQDYPADYLRRWDELCARAPHTGVAANDAHQNIGLVLRLLEEDKVRFEDALGKKLLELPIGLVPGVGAARTGKHAGDVLFKVQMDPYATSLRHVGTHVLLTELSAKAVWAALEAGRAFVAFDWLADATGFDFVVRSATTRWEMGSRLPFADGLRLEAQAPLPVRWKLIADGKVLAESSGRTMNRLVTEPGNYRVEAWLRVAGEDLVWILSNPIFVRPK